MIGDEIYHSYIYFVWIKSTMVNFAQNQKNDLKVFNCDLMNSLKSVDSFVKAFHVFEFLPRKTTFEILVMYFWVLV